MSWTEWYYVAPLDDDEIADRNAEVLERCSAKDWSPEIFKKINSVRGTKRWFGVNIQHELGALPFDSFDDWIAKPWGIADASVCVIEKPNDAVLRWPQIGMRARFISSTVFHVFIRNWRGRWARLNPLTAWNNLSEALLNKKHRANRPERPWYYHQTAFMQFPLAMLSAYDNRHLISGDRKYDALGSG